MCPAWLPVERNVRQVGKQDLPWEAAAVVAVVPRTENHQVNLVQKMLKLGFLQPLHHREFS